MACSRVQRSQIIGDIIKYPTKADAKRAVDGLRLEINSVEEPKRISPMTLAEAWGHFQANELRDPDVDRSPTTIRAYHDYFRVHIIPTWGRFALIDIKSVAVEKWLRSLKLSPAPKAKIRNHMSSLFSHCIRHELYERINPISSVRQGAKRLKDPDVLNLEEMQALLVHIELPAAAMMVSTVAASGLRRSEMRGLKWEDLDLENCWFHCCRGLVNRDETKMKTIASRKSMEMNPSLAKALKEWQKKTEYAKDSDWVFASPFTKGKHPYWPDMVLKNHVRPAALKAGIKKTIGWHTFRHSLGTLMGSEGENVKVVQELLRHASSRITLDIYQQAASPNKRSALNRLSPIFVDQAKAS